MPYLISLLPLQVLGVSLTTDDLEIKTVPVFLNLNLKDQIFSGGSACLLLLFVLHHVSKII